MKILTLSKLLTYSTSPDEIKNIHTLLIINKGYQSIEDFSINSTETTKKSYNPLFIHTHQLCLSYNYLTEKDLSTIWSSFPSIWWLVIAFNQIKSLSSISFPLALGLLDLTGVNDYIQSSELIHLSSMHLLRLHIDINEEYILENHNLNNINIYIASILPNVWVINDDFITNAERTNTIVIQNDSNNYFNSNNITSNASIVTDTLSSEQWSTLHNHLNSRSKNLLRMIQDCPYNINKADEFKLDILLEDYYHQVCYYNTYIDSITSMNNGTQSLRNIPFMPVFDIKMIYFLPHRLQLDLSVLLTTCILFTIPKNLLKDALVILLINYIPIIEIENLMQLPRFIKTALVSLLRRLVKKEKLELDTTGTMLLRDSYLRKDITNLKQKQQNFITQSYNNNIMDGFYYLRFIKEYLNSTTEQPQQPNLNSSNYIPTSQVKFSEIEIEILTKLPDVPNYASFKQQIEANDPEWVAFAARHTVLLLTKSPSCPPLTKTQTSKVKQDLYIELLPILKAASMTLSDLDIQALGPSYDGRMLMKKSTLSGIRRRSSTICGKDKKATDHSNKETATTLSSSIDFLGGHILPFGAGIPNASPVTSLSWKVNEDTIPRNYDMSWRTDHYQQQQQLQHKEVAADNEEVAMQSNEHLDSTIFLTTVDNPNNSNHNTTTSSNHHYISKHVVELNSCYAIHEYINLSNDTIVDSLEVEALAPLSRGNSRNTARDRTSLVPLPSNDNITNPSDSLTLLTAPHQDNVYTNTEWDIVPDYTKQYPPKYNLLTNTNNTSTATNNPTTYSTNNTNTNNATTTTTNINTTTRINPSSLHQVSGFSADACWNNRFLLAPPRAIHQVNTAITASLSSPTTTTTSKQYDFCNQWDAIELAPVVIHSSATRIPFDTVIKVFTNNEANNNHTINNVNKQIDATTSIVSNTNSTNNSQLMNFDDESTYFDKSNGSIVLDNHEKYIPNNAKTINTKDLELQLLREMGTIRNVNKLNESNKKVKDIINGTNNTIYKANDELLLEDESISHIHDTSVYDTNSIKSDTFLTDIINSNDYNNDINIDNKLNYLESSKINSELQDNVPTNISISSTTLDEFIDANNTNNNTNNNINNNMRLRKSISIPKHLHEPPLKELLNSISTLDILKSKQKYSKIYTSNQAVESGDVGVNGVVITPTWYPLLDKKFYRLANQALDQNKVLTKPLKLLIKQTQEDIKLRQKTFVKDNKIVTYSLKNKLLDNHTLEIVSDHMVDRSKSLPTFDSNQYINMKNDMKGMEDNNNFETLDSKPMDKNGKELDENLINNDYFRSLLIPQKKKNSNNKNKTSYKLSSTSKVLHHKANNNEDSMVYMSNSVLDDDTDLNKKHVDSIITNQTSETLLRIETPQLIYRNPPSEIISTTNENYPHIQLSNPTTSIDLKKDSKSKVPKSLLLAGVSIKGNNVMQFTDTLEENTTIRSINSKTSGNASLSVNSKTSGNASLSVNSATQGLKDIIGSYHSSIGDTSADGWDMISETTSYHIEENHIKNPTLKRLRKHSNDLDNNNTKNNTSNNNPYLLRLHPEFDVNNEINSKHITTTTTTNTTQKMKEPLFYHTIMDKEHFNRTKPYSFRFNGQSEHPWIGTNQYKAATHKIQLNRNFKYTLPPLDKINTDI